MDLHLLIVNILFPFLLGGAIVATSKRISMSQAFICGLLGLSVAVIYTLHEGLPAYPAISSKHKISYALLALPVLMSMLSGRGSGTQAIGLATFIGVCFVWLVQKRLTSGNLQLHWLLPLMTILVFYLANIAGKAKPRSPFSWPVALLSMSVVGCLTALLGGYLGLGQIFLSASAFLGGLTLTIYLFALSGVGTDLHLSASPYLALQAGITLLLVQLSTFATNLSVLAYFLLLALFGLPVIAHRTSNLSLALQPFALAALGLIAGIPAILFAINNF